MEAESRHLHIHRANCAVFMHLNTDASESPNEQSDVSMEPSRFMDAAFRARSIVVFDTETTGLPDRDPSSKGRMPNPRNASAYARARVVQVAWVTLNADGRITGKHSRIIRPDGFIVGEDSTKIHGISHGFAEAVGVGFESVAEELACALEQAELAVGHNVAFDFNVLLAEAFRYDCQRLIAALYACPRFDTMWEGKREFGLGKIPKLVELHSLLFGKEYTQIHDALDDTLLARKCFQRLVANGRSRALRVSGSLRPRAMIRKPARYCQHMANVPF